MLNLRVKGGGKHIKNYAKGKRAYLSTIKDASTNEILSYSLSTSLALNIATDTIHKLMQNKDIQIDSNAFIHSDQGTHYTSPAF